MSLLVPWSAHDTAFIVPSCLGLAVIDATVKLTGHNDRIALKWPNDLVVRLSGRKLGGLLSEAVHKSGSLVGIVCGVGVNVTWPMLGDEVDESLSDATCLAAFVDAAPPLREFAQAIVGSFDYWLSVVEQHGIDPVLIRYRQQCATLGRSIELRTETEVVIGVAVDVSDNGHLVVETDAGLRNFSTGDVTRVRSP